MSTETHRVYLKPAQMRALGELADDGSGLVVIHQEDLMSGRQGIHGWVMVETITGTVREIVTLDNDGNKRTVEEVRAAIEAG